MLNCFIAERLLWITLTKKAQWLRKAVVDDICKEGPVVEKDY